MLKYLMYCQIDSETTYIGPFNHASLCSQTTHSMHIQLLLIISTTHALSYPPSYFHRVPIHIQSQPNPPFSSFQSLSQLNRLPQFLSTCP